MSPVTEKIQSDTKMTGEGGNHKDAGDLIKGVLFNFLGMVVKVSKVLFVFVAAKYYGATALGLYFLAWSTVDIASKFGLWGMDKSLVRDIARYNTDRSPQTNQRILGIMYFNIRVALLLSILANAVVFGVSPWIATLIFKDAALVLPLRILSFSIPFVVLTLVLIATTKALRLMQYEVLVRQGIEPMVLLAATLALIPFGLGATGLAVAHVVASFVAAVAAFVVVLRKFRYLGWNPKPLGKQMKSETLRYTSPIAAMDFLNLLVARTDIVLVGALMNSTSAGLYGIAVEIISVIKRIRQGFEPIFAPIVSELFYNEEKKRLQRNYILVTRWLMAGSLLPVVAMVMLPKQILGFFEVESAQAAAALVVLALAHGLFGTFSAAESLLVMTGKTLLNALLGALMLAVNVAVTLFLIPRLGLVGAAVGTLAAFFTVSSARIYQGYRQLRLLPFSAALFWPLLTASATAAVFYVIKTQLHIDTIVETISMLIVLIIMYTGIYFLGASEPEEKHLWAKLKRKYNRFRRVPENP